MPACRNCHHPGASHRWTIRRTLHGKCFDCDCPGYIPNNGLPRPANNFIGKLRRPKTKRV